jgi:hypothetical protein
VSLVKAAAVGWETERVTADSAPSWSPDGTQIIRGGTRRG